MGAPPLGSQVLYASGPDTLVATVVAIVDQAAGIVNLVVFNAEGSMYQRPNVTLGIGQGQFRTPPSTGFARQYQTMGG